MNRTEHLLVCLAEECGEVIQSVGKALRFGLDHGYSDRTTTNAQDIAHNEEIKRYIDDAKHGLTHKETDGHGH
jgi:hypothetical protein